MLTKLSDIAFTTVENAYTFWVAIKNSYNFGVIKVINWQNMD
jgi:hypothetical protein